MVIEILLLVACVCCDVCYRCKTVAAIATKLSVQTGKLAMDHSPGGSTSMVRGAKFAVAGTICCETV